MKGLESYIIMTIVASVIIVGIFLLGVSGLLTGDKSITTSMAAEIVKVGSDGCGSDADCKGSGVCVSAKCVCFYDSQCQAGCDKSIGKCR